MNNVIDNVATEVWCWIAEKLGTMQDWFNFCCTCRLFAAIGRDLRGVAKKRLAYLRVFHEGPAVRNEFYQLANGDYHGLYTSYHGNVITEQVNYVDDKREGVYQKFSRLGRLKEQGRYIQGARVGWYLDHRADTGSIIYSNYGWGEEIERYCYNSDGELLSLHTPDSHILYRSNGMIAEATYTEGPRVTKYAYDRDGKLQHVTESTAADSQGCTCYFNADGSFESVTYYDTRRGHNGYNIRWHDEGPLARAAYYCGGYPEGEVYCYHENGNLRSVTEFRDGKRNGYHREWDDKGNLISMEWEGTLPH